jgi:hypothetical protein
VTSAFGGQRSIQLSYGCLTWNLVNAAPLGNAGRPGPLGAGDLRGAARPRPRANASHPLTRVGIGVGMRP